MIDIHSHILYGVDDGSESLDYTLNMLKIAKMEGITSIIATPHYIHGYNCYDTEQLKKRYEEVKQLVKEHHLGIDIYLGNELSIDYRLHKALKDGYAKTLAGSSYILVEFPLGEWSEYLEHVLFKLSVSGYKIIIAHVERYKKVVKNLNLVKDWIEKGYYIQVNAGSITGLQGSIIKEEVLTLIKHNMVHFVGTDCHSPNKRAPYLKEAYSAVSEWVGKDKADQLFNDYPMCILKNHNIPNSYPIGIKPRNILQQIIARCTSIL